MIDITLEINESMRVYKNMESKKPILKVATDFSTSDVYESVIEMNLHTGTHIDFPKHVIENGKTSSDYDISKFSGKCYVLDVTYLDRRITLKDVKSINLNSYEFLIFKTKNSNNTEYNFDFIYLAEDAAEYISKFNLKGVGIDGLGIEREQENHPTHHHLLGRDILIFEGLNLKNVEEGVYEFFGIPLNIANVEALPVRAFLK